MQKDEVFTSHNNEKINIDFICTFVGFKKYLVVNFLKQMLSIYNVRKIILVTSKRENTFHSIHTDLPNEEILRESIEYINKQKISLDSEIEIETKRINFIWDFFEYSKELSKIEGSSALINLSAGPAAYTSFAIVWAISRNYSVAYSVESKKYGDLEPNVVFKQINITPYMNYIFKTDQIDKEIVGAVISGHRKSSNIRERLNQLGFEYSLRTIETRIIELKRKKILHISGEKIYKISVEEAIEKLIIKK